MQCERLIKLIKSWYLNVKDETMAPARMVAFIEEHVADCDLCLADPDIRSEIEKITEIVLPESKIPKAVRLAQEKEENSYVNEEESKDEDELKDDDSEDDDEEELDPELEDKLDDEI